MTVTTASSLPDGVAGTVYNAFLCSSIPFATSVGATGNFPPGLYITLSGYNWILYGTPTRKGTYTFTVNLTDRIDNESGSTTPLTVIIRDGHLLMRADYHLADKPSDGHLLCGLSALPTINSPPTLPPATQSQAYSYTLSAVGGTPGYSFSVLSGSFPSGISMSSYGVISGTTSVSPGTYTVVIKLTDSTGNYSSSVFTLAVVAQAQFSFQLNWTNPGSYPNFSLYVIDPANYGYSTWALGDSDADWLQTPGSAYVAADPSVPTSSQVSPNGGKMNSVCRYDQYSLGGHYWNYPWPPQIVSWPGVASPTGVFAFWVHQDGVGYGSGAQYTMSILNGSSTLWTQSGWLTQYTSSYLWRFNSATNAVY